MNAEPFLIGDRWETGDGASFPVVNPADGSEVGRVATASAGDVDRAVAAARKALSDPSWAKLKFHERGRLLSRVADLLERETEPLARAQMLDNGKTIAECRSQVAAAAAVFRYYAAVAETFESEVTTQRGPSMTMTVYEPAGVVAAITPWNSPLTLEAQKLAPILAAGNTVVLKPSEVTPHPALAYGRLFLEAGFPAGVVNIVTGAGDTGKALVEHAGVDLVSFTGGTRAGRAIAETCGRLLRPVVLELGGKSPNIVFADADFDRAVKGVAGGIFTSGGQSCIAGSRVFVEEPIFDRFLAALAAEADGFTMGHPENAATRLGPLRASPIATPSPAMSSGQRAKAPASSPAARCPSRPRSTAAHTIRQPFLPASATTRASARRRYSGRLPWCFLFATRPRFSRRPTISTSASPPASGRRTIARHGGWAARCAPERSG